MPSDSLIRAVLMQRLEESGLRERNRKRAEAEANEETPMLLHDRFAGPLELAFVGDGSPGVFEGYGAVTGNVDFYGHVIEHGAFAETLSKHAAAGTMPGMYAEHSAFELGGDPLPIGVWQAMSEDTKGLHVKGKISALDTDHSKRIVGLMRDKAITGLSIAFKVPQGGDVRSTKQGEPKRRINKLELYSVDLVRDPANSQAQVLMINSVMKSVDAQACCDSIAACMKMHLQTLGGNNSPTADQRQQMMGHLMDAHRALTGQDMPMGMMSGFRPKTIREYEGWLREEFHLSHSQARAIADLGFVEPRDEAGEQAAAAAVAAAALEARSATVKELSSLIQGFSLTSKG